MDVSSDIFPVIASLLFLGWIGWKCLCRAMDGDNDVLSFLSRWMGTLILLGLCIYTARSLAQQEGLVAHATLLLLLVTTGMVLGILWAPTWGEFIATPLTVLFDGGREEWQSSPPSYSLAEALRRQGDYPQARKEVQRQLSKSPSDLRGHLLLMQLYLEDGHKVESAVVSLEAYLGTVPLDPSTGSHVMEQLADLSLYHQQDPHMALYYLRRIRYQYPSTPQAAEALRRIDEIKNGLMRQRVDSTSTHPDLNLDSVPFELMEVSPPLDLGRSAEKVQEGFLPIFSEEIEGREELAISHAKEENKPRLAIEELRQLVYLPNQPEACILRWCYQIVDVACMDLSDAGLAKEALRNCIKRMPTTKYHARMKARLARVRRESRSARKLSRMFPLSSVIA